LAVRHDDQQHDAEPVRSQGAPSKEPTQGARTAPRAFNADAIALMGRLVAKLGPGHPTPQDVVSALRDLREDDSPGETISEALNHSYGNHLNGKVLALLHQGRKSKNDENEDHEQVRQAGALPAVAGGAGGQKQDGARDDRAAKPDPQPDLDVATELRRAQADLLPSARRNLNAYQQAGQRGDGGALREHARSLLDDIEAIERVRDQAQPGGEAGAASSSGSGAEQTQWYSFRAMLTVLLQELARGVGPGSLGGGVSGAQAGHLPPTTYAIKNQIGTVVRLVGVADNVLHVVAEARPWSMGHLRREENNAVRLIEQWRGRPSDFFFLLHMVRAKDPATYEELRTGQPYDGKPLAPTSPVSGHTIDKLSTVTQSNAREFGQDTNVGTWDPGAVKSNGRTLVEQALTAKGSDGGAAVLRRVFSSGMILAFMENLLPQEALELDAKITAKLDPEIKEMLELKWGPWARGEHRETLSHLIDRIPYPRARKLVHAARAFMDAGFGEGHDKAIEAEDTGEATSAEASKMQAQNLITTASALAGAVGAAQIGGAVAHAIGDGLAPLLGRSAPTLIGAAGEGAAAGAGGLGAADYARNQMGLQDGASSLEEYILALVMGGTMSTLSAGGQLAYRAAKGRPLSGIASVEMTVADLRRLGRTLNQTVDEMIAGLAGPEALPEGGLAENTPVQVKVRATGQGPGGVQILEARIVETQGRKGGWNEKLNKPQGGNTYEITETSYEFKTDSDGRTNKVKADLSLEEGDRNRYQQRKAGGADRQATDQGGHLIANIFKGPGEGINLVAMGFDLNNGAWKSLETKWAKALGEGKGVRVSIDVRYAGSSRRPSVFEITYKIEGGPTKEVVFRND